MMAPTGDDFFRHGRSSKEMSPLQYHNPFPRLLQIRSLQQQEGVQRATALAPTHARTYSRTHGDQAIVSSTDYRYVEPPGEGAPAAYGQCTSARTSQQHHLME